MSNQPTLQLPEPEQPLNAAQLAADQRGLIWLVPLLHNTCGKLMSIKQVARAMGSSRHFVHSLIQAGELEHHRIGHDYRIYTRSVMQHLWESWSGRAKATNSQIVVFISAMLGHLPTVALSVISETCLAIIAKRVQAERSLGLVNASSKPAAIKAAMQFNPCKPAEQPAQAKQSDLL